MHLALPGDRGGDLASVEASVFDEDVRGIFTADHYASYVNTGTIGFESFRVCLGPGGFGIEANPLPFEKAEVRM